MKIKIKRNRNYTAVWVLWCTLSGVLWLLLLGLKAAGAVRTSWPAAVLGIIWIPWLAMALFAAAGSVLVTAARLKRWYRRRKVDRRIIRQAYGISARRHSVAALWSSKRGRTSRSDACQEKQTRNFAAAAWQRLTTSWRTRQSKGGRHNGL